ncbi:MAG TPA: septation protein A [Rhizomicrobium sp.]|jgi:intracellular septation protein|nr:septation protein A [Rhizomicrobium sp.]
MNSVRGLKTNPWVRLALDLGPLLLFFGCFKFFGIYVATASFMGATLGALAVGYALERRLSPMPVVTAALVLVFGGLTLYLKNDVFIKMKPTVLYTFFGVMLLGGLAFGRLFIKNIFAQAFELNEEGWRKLTIRWGIFALFLAALNEIVWRNFSTTIWVDFKVWGILPMFFLFALAQAPLIGKHQLEENSSPLEPKQEL